MDYPAEGSIFPPEITPPEFIWRDEARASKSWRVDLAFSDGSAPMRFESSGQPPRVGDIDPRCVAETNELPKLTPQQAASHTWTPDAQSWEAIKKRSIEHDVTVTISGFVPADSAQPVSRGRVTFRTSKDPVGAPIFYRDVPLMPSELEKGVIKPLADNAIKLINWRLRNIGQTSSHVLLTNMPTCANCHSFSRDGKTLGMDVDGPENDKGTYAIAPIRPHMSISSDEVITWNSFRGKTPGLNTLGFMSQISPDGQFAVTTLNESVYVSNFKDYRTLQVFYPTRGILGFYSRATGQMQALPGADDPRYVQTDSVWSPDGKYIVFARAEATDAYPRGRKIAEYANDPNEVPIKYDLYRIPFNGGKGGRAEPIAGASRNGMSNSFPKVSPDGRWLVFVEARNGQLLRPDSQLYIVPADGGQARRMRCNTPHMNSWHSFSPNGRWMVFSSKSRSPYTQMYLTHIDEQGKDSPAILIDNSTAANRAVNLPEFVNIPPDGLLNIDVPAADFYRVFDRAVELAKNKQYDAAVAEWKKAMSMSPGDAKAHNNLGVVLVRQEKFTEAIEQFRRAIEIKPAFEHAQYNLACALAHEGKMDEAVAHWRKTLAINPEFAEARNRLAETLIGARRLDEAIGLLDEGLQLEAKDAEAEYNLGRALAEKGRLDEAITHWQRSVEIKPAYTEAHNNLGVALVRKGRAEDAITQFRAAIGSDPRYADAHYNLGRALAGKGMIEEALAEWNKAIEIRPAYAEARYALGSASYARGKPAEALVQWRTALAAQPDNVTVLTQVAWALATCDDAGVRNGAEAVTIAEKAARLSDGRDARALDALAAAYAEAGRFQQAVETLRRALALAPQQNLEAMRGRLALYEAGRPFHETH